MSIVQNENSVVTLGRLHRFLEKIKAMIPAQQNVPKFELEGTVLKITTEY